MKIIVDEMPKNDSRCLFSKVKKKELICTFDEHCSVSYCYGVNNCPYLIAFDNYLDKRIKEHYNGLL